MILWHSTANRRRSLKHLNKTFNLRNKCRTANSLRLHLVSRQLNKMLCPCHSPPASHNSRLHKTGPTRVLLQWHRLSRQVMHQPSPHHRLNKKQLRRLSTICLQQLPLIFPAPLRPTTRRTVLPQKYKHRPPQLQPHIKTWNRCLCNWMKGSTMKKSSQKWSRISHKLLPLFHHPKTFLLFPIKLSTEFFHLFS